jgi:hypothetical protein
MSWVRGMGIGMLRAQEHRDRRHNWIHNTRRLAGRIIVECLIVLGMGQAVFVVIGVYSFCGCCSTNVVQMSD